MEQEQQQQQEHQLHPPPPPQQQTQQNIEGNGHLEPREPPQEYSGLPKKVATSKYIKEEKIAILTTLLDVGMELWEMEKQINKPWRSLYWEQRVALPVRRKLKSNLGYMEHGIDIDAKFGGSAAVENLRKWVRSQKTQELERVEGERQRIPGSPPGRPLSEVQKLRAKVFEEIASATSEKDGGGDGVAEGDTEMVAAAAAATAAAAGGVEGGRDAGVMPFAGLFSPASNGGGASSAAPASSPAPSPSSSASPAPVHGGISTGSANTVLGASAGADPSSFLRQQYQLHAPSTSAAPSTTIATTNGVANNRPVLTRPFLAVGGAAESAHCSIPDPLVNSIDVSGGDSFGAAGTHAVSGAGTSAVVAAAAAAAKAVSAASAIGAGLGGTVTPYSRWRSASETTPEDFRLVGAGLASTGGGGGGGMSAGLQPPPAKRKKKAEDHTELVGRVMTQINSLNLPLAASTLLVETLQAKIAGSSSSCGAGQGTGAGGSSAPGGTVNEESKSRGGGLTLEERQLLLEERLQASREAEAAQALAERRLKLMEEMRAAGNHEVVTDEVLQKQRLVVLGL
eukprot:g8679.t1